MQNASNISLYESLPIYQIFNLEEVVIEKSEKTQNVAIQLFGNLSAELNEKILNYKRISDRSIAAGCLTTFAGFTPGFVANYLDYRIGLVGSACSLFFIYPFIKYSDANFKWAKKAQSLSDKWESIKEFHECFEKFKLDPQEYKVKGLFEHFSIIGCINMQESEFVAEDDSKFFDSLGKLFLMDAVADVLLEKNQHSKIATLWNERSKTELWYSIGTSTPEAEAYGEFDNLRGHIESIEIADRIVGIYKNAIETGLKNNKI